MGGVAGLALLLLAVFFIIRHRKNMRGNERSREIQNRSSELHATAPPRSGYQDYPEVEHYKTHSPSELSGLRNPAELAS